MTDDVAPGWFHRHHNQLQELSERIDILMATAADILTALTTLQANITGKVLAPGQVAVAQTDLDQIAADVSALTALVAPPAPAPVTISGTQSVVVPTLPTA